MTTCVPSAASRSAEGVRQAAQRNLQHRAQVPRRRQRRRAHGKPDLRLVMPQFRELAADVEPPLRCLLARPRHRKERRRVERQLLEEVGEVGARPLEQIRQDVRAESPRRLDKVVIEAVDEVDEILLAGDRPARRRRRHPVAMKRQPAKGQVHEMRDDVADDPRAGDRGPVPSVGGKAAQQRHKIG